MFENISLNGKGKVKFKAKLYELKGEKGRLKSKNGTLRRLNGLVLHLKIISN